MNIVLSGKSASKCKKNKLQERFEKLQKRLQKQRQKNERFKAEMDELVDLHRSHSQAVDNKQIETLKALSEKLIRFAGKKSLSEWHRDELVEWIMELVGRVEAIDPDIATLYRKDYHEAVAHVLGMSVEELEEEYHARREAFEEAIREEFEEKAKPPFDDQPEDVPFQDDLFGFDDFDMEFPGEGDDSFANGPDFFVEEDEPEKRRERIMDEKWIKGLFRRAAQALHPDREQNDEVRREKQQQMRELLEARKKGDIMTLLSIYSENVDDGDIEIAEQEMSLVCEMLEQQIDDLEMDKMEEIYANPYRHMVYDILYAPGKKARDRNIREWKKELRLDGEENRELLTYLRNLERLKNVLRERRDQRSFLDEIMFGF